MSARHHSLCIVVCTSALTLGAMLSACGDDDSPAPSTTTVTTTTGSGGAGGAATDAKDAFCTNLCTKFSTCIASEGLDACMTACTQDAVGSCDDASLTALQACVDANSCDTEGAFYVCGAETACFGTAPWVEYSCDALCTKFDCFASSGQGDCLQSCKSDDFAGKCSADDLAVFDGCVAGYSCAEEETFYDCLSATSCIGTKPYVEYVCDKTCTKFMGCLEGNQSVNECKGECPEGFGSCSVAELQSLLTCVDANTCATEAELDTCVAAVGCTNSGQGGAGGSANTGGNSAGGNSAGGSGGSGGS